jgi:carboxypeptidase Q
MQRAYHMHAFLVLGCLAAVIGASSPDDMLQEVHDHQADVNKIVSYLSAGGAGAGAAFDTLAAFVDTIGPRLVSSVKMQDAVQYMEAALKADGFVTHTEEVMVPYWERGEESLEMTAPRSTKLGMLGLGLSVGTPAPIETGIVVVQSFDELEALGEPFVVGKIVVFNQQCDWDAMPIACYGKTVQYRVSG